VLGVSVMHLGVEVLSLLFGTQLVPVLPSLAQD
jgi:hypothetical protein